MSNAIAFCGNPLHRASNERRDPKWIESRLRDESARLLPLWRLQPLVKFGAERNLAWARWEMFEDMDDTATPILLGVDGDVAHFAVDCSFLDEPAEGQLGVDGAAAFEDLRAVAGSLPVEETGIAAQARSLVDWHARHAWCPECGGGTRPRDAGGMRVCGDCLVEQFPRINPVAIGLVVEGDRCLLGRQKGWPAGMYSALAGFVEFGETLEDAFRREVKEEAGVHVGEVRYVRSQPWPFPASLMIGCIGEALSSEIDVDSHEIEEARWFDKEVVRSSLAGRSSELFVPPAMSLAHHLMREWAK